MESKPVWKSKKFWAMIASIAFALVQVFFKEPEIRASAEDIYKAILLFMGATGFVDAARVFGLPPTIAQMLNVGPATSPRYIGQTGGMGGRVEESE